MTGTARPAVEDAERAVVYLRDVAPGGLNERQRRVLASLRVAARRGALDAVDADVWSVPAGTAAVAPDETAVGALLARFHAWAAEHGRSLEPAFAGVGGAVGEDSAASRDGSAASDDAGVTTDPTAGVELPLVCVGLFDGDDVVAVYPHAVDGETRTVGDLLDRLERAAAEPAEA